MAYAKVTKDKNSLKPEPQIIPSKKSKIKKAPSEIRPRVKLKIYRYLAYNQNIN